MPICQMKKQRLEALQKLTQPEGAVELGDYAVTPGSNRFYLPGPLVKKAFPGGANESERG